MRMTRLVELLLLALSPFLSEARAMDTIEPRLSSASPGVVIIAFGAPAPANSLAFQQDGTIALAVSARIAGSGRALLLRITPDGRLADHPATVVGDITSTASNVAVATDNSIVLIGSGYAPRAAANEQSRADFMVARFLPDGRPDQGFAREGWPLTDVGELKDHDEPYAVAVQPDGKIVVTGSSNVRYWLIMRAYSFETVRYDGD